MLQRCVHKRLSETHKSICSWENFSKTGGCGPFLTLESTVKDHQSLTIKTILNGEVMQEARLDQLIFKIPEIVSHISSFTPLVAGDIIVTGTPGGVGDRRDPPFVYEKWRHCRG